MPTQRMNVAEERRASIVRLLDAARYRGARADLARAIGVSREAIRKLEGKGRRDLPEAADCVFGECHQQSCLSDGCELAREGWTQAELPDANVDYVDAEKGCRLCRITRSIAGRMCLSCQLEESFRLQAEQEVSRNKGKRGFVEGTPM